MNPKLTDMKAQTTSDLRWPLAVAGYLATSRSVLTGISAISDPGEASVRIGYEIAPVPLNTRGKNRVLVGLGSYLVNAQLACSSSQMSNRDLRAVHEYLAALTSRPHSPNAGS
jgi:hypothetical protein